MRKIQKTAIVGGTVAVLLAGGVAFAAWTSSGSGSGDATAGSEASLTVDVGTASDLFPTGSQDITVTVTNDNPYPVALTGITLDDLTVDAGHSLCTTTGIVTATDEPTATDHLAKAGDLGDSVLKTFAVSMDAGASDACKGATFTLDYTATAASSN